MNIALFIALVATSLSLSLTSSSECSFVYGEWSICSDSVQTRTIDCVCSGEIVGVEQCLDAPLPLEQECKPLFVNCNWKWSRWSICSATCGGGNTTREPLCYCDNLSDAVPDEHCDMETYYGVETVPCNQFSCGQIPAFNKLYWIEKEDSLDWPILSTQFNCSMGDDPKDSPKGKTFSEILTDPYTSTHLHYQWHYLAKEWIAAELNIINGVEFSEESKLVISQVSKLLEFCGGFREEQIPLIYGLKEKLGRLNNNIGGLSNVDNQVAMITGGNNEEQEIAKEAHSLLVVSIVVPLSALMIIVVAFGSTIFYVREKTNIAQDHFGSESDDEEEEVGFIVEKNSESVPLGEPVHFYDNNEISLV